ncbi:MAG: hypothetical protein JWP38_84 [Herbaspirillum sp.]|jgi:hypothetical protein|nr:hypothetical protein [Herbaspirillum sp.]
MDVTGIAAIATSLAQQSTSDQVNILVLKKALNSQATLAAGLLNALPAPTPAPTLTSSMGHTIDTTA